MADPKVMKEGERDVELEKAQKGYQKYEAEQQSAQKKIEDQDRAARETVQKAKEKIKSFLPFKAGGSVSSASKRADGCAQRGKTRGKMV
jgi:peptidoglycan hydrolase CwlO-like protein